MPGDKYIKTIINLVTKKVNQNFILKINNKIDPNIYIKITYPIGLRLNQIILIYIKGISLL